MLSLKVNEDSRTIKDEFIDVTLNELSAGYKFIGGLDSETKRYLLTAAGSELENSKLFEFKINWIALFSDLTINELKLIPQVESSYSNLSIDWLYNHCKKFIHQPESYIELKEFEHQGIQYNLIEPLKTISGASLLFGNANYRQFMIGSQLTAVIHDQKNERGIESLKRLLALLYSDGDDLSEDIVKRSEKFGEVNALYGWSAYFFFAQSVERYKDYSPLSTTANPPQKAAAASVKQQLKALLSRTIFGRLWQSKLQKRGFLIRKT